MSGQQFKNAGGKGDDEFEAGADAGQVQARVAADVVAQVERWLQDGTTTRAELVRVIEARSG